MHVLHYIHHPNDREITPIHVHSPSLTAQKEPSNDVNSWINTLGCLSFPCSKWRALYRSSWAEFLTTVPEAGVCTVLLLLRDSWCMSLLLDTTTCVPHFPCLSNVLLIYTCWALGCIGIRCTLTASITQQALLLPFKIHLKWFAGATVQPGMNEMILMRYCEECFAVVALLGTAGDLCAPFPVSVSE